MIKNYLIKCAILLTFLQVICGESSSTGCQIPNNAQTELIIKLHPANETVALGTFIDDFEIIHIECKNGLLRRGLPTLLCHNGKWNDDFPACENYCDESLIHGISTQAICDPDGDGVAHLCKPKIPINTVIQINCNSGFTSDKPTQQIRCLANGTFSEKRLPCSLNCGRVTETAVFLSKGGLATKPSQVPWNVAIYERGIENLPICMGSIVSPRIVISAAHCFYDHSNLVKKVSEFHVIAGQIMKNNTQNTNKNKQTADVAEIHIPEDYKGSSNEFFNDIAIVVLKTPLEYNNYISAICITTLGSPSPDSYVISKLPGFITGFGTNNQLEKLNMVTKSYHECIAESPIAQDKFCILNNDGGSVCRGESGGGFVRELRDDINESVYKLLGVISISAITKTDCADNNALVAVTSMNFLPAEFVQKLLKAIKEDESSF